LDSKRRIWKGLGITLGIVAVAASAFLAGRAGASGIPSAEALRYSGILFNADGTSPLMGSHNVQVTFWDSQSEASGRVCETTSTEQQLKAGRFSVVLPNECVSAVTNNPDLWVEVLVDGMSLGRVKISAVPYAIEAANASGAVGALAQQLVPAGAVMAFDLASCPSGWTELTQARGRVIVGAGPGLTRGTAVGANSLTLSTAQLPAHTHTGTTGSGNPMKYRIVGVLGQSTFNNHSPGWASTSMFTDFTDTNYPMSLHTHDFTTDATGSGAAIDNRQESLPLLYCKKN
jgi:microcystin-dependent protein